MHFQSHYFNFILHLSRICVVSLSKSYTNWNACICNFLNRARNCVCCYEVKERSYVRCAHFNKCYTMYSQVSSELFLSYETDEVVVIYYSRTKIYDSTVMQKHVECKWMRRLCVRRCQSSLNTRTHKRLDTFLVEVKQRSLLENTAENYQGFDNSWFDECSDRMCAIAHQYAWTKLMRT